MRAPQISRFALVLAFAGGTACTTQSDAEFVEQASSGGLLEVQLGRYAAEHAADPEVRQFGQKMVDEHSQANQTLTAAAQRAGIQPATTMNDEHRGMLDELTRKQGAEFDAAYMDAMVKDHEADVEAFRGQAEDQSSEIDRWAAQTLPTLEAHLQHARELDTRIEERGAEASR